MFGTLFSIIFIFKCIISKRKSIHHHIRSKYNLNVLTKVRLWEKSRRRMIKSELDTAFLNTCLLYDYVPQFMQFKLHKKSLYNSSWYRKTIKQILYMEIKSRKASFE